MADSSINFFSAVKSASYMLFSGRQIQAPPGDTAQDSVSNNFQKALESNFVKLADEYVSSSGNIKFDELTTDGDFHKAGFNKMNPRVEEALSFLVNQVFK